MACTTMLPPSMRRSSRSGRTFSKVVFCGGESTVDGSGEQKLFDEAAYLARYPDVVEAVSRNVFSSGLDHYRRHGIHEGRIGTKILSVPTVSLADIQPFATFKNARIKTFAPTVFGRENMRTDFQNMYKVVWNQDRPESSIDCFVLENVVVAGEGIVFDHLGRVYSETIRESSLHDVEQCYLQVKDLLLNDSSKTIAGTALLCAKAGVRNYGHWLFEMLPLALLLEGCCPGHDIAVPQIENNSNMNLVIEDSLNLIGVTSDRIKRFDGCGKFGKLIVARGFSLHGSYYSPHAIAAFDLMVKQVRGQGAERIWVSRTRTARRLADEQTVCETLATRGWTIASPEHMSLREQIALFKDAKVVAGVNGAGLTNIAFAPAGLKIISFVPQQMPDIFFWMLSQFKKQDFYEVRCVQENLGPGEFNWQCRLMLDADQTLAYIDAALDETNAGDPILSAEAPFKEGNPVVTSSLSNVQEHYNYLNQTVKTIEGWLNDYPALQTMYLLDLQEERGQRGSLIEIGIYRGRHLSLLLRAAGRSTDPVYAIDTMELVSEAEVRQTIEKIAPSVSCTLMAGSSGAMTSSEVLSWVNNVRPRFISIDGSHECENVLWDLRLADDIITSEGVVSVADFMNWTAIGVNEGVHRFFASQRNVVPFAMSSNKLFLCRPHMAIFYRETLECYADEDTADSHSSKFVERRNAWRGSIESSLWGYKILNFF